MLFFIAYLYIHVANSLLPTPVSPYIIVWRPLGGYIIADLAKFTFSFKLPFIPINSSNPSSSTTLLTFTYFPDDAGSLSLIPIFDWFKFSSFNNFETALLDILYPFSINISVIFLSDIWGFSLTIFDISFINIFFLLSLESKILFFFLTDITSDLATFNISASSWSVYGFFLSSLCISLNILSIFRLLT